MGWTLFLRDLKSSNTPLGGVRVIFPFEHWKHDFLAIFDQRVCFSALQPKSLKNPLRRQYRAILVKLSQLQSLVAT